MAEVWRPLSVEEAASDSAGVASTVSNARWVRLINTSSAAVLVTLAEGNDATIGSFSLMSDEQHIIEKAQEQKIFAAAADVKLVKITAPK